MSGTSPPVDTQSGGVGVHNGGLADEGGAALHGAPLLGGVAVQTLEYCVPILNNETAIEGAAAGLLQDANKNMEYSPF